MNLPMPSPKVTPLIAMVAMGLMAGAYLLFLFSTWKQYQRDRETKHDVINELLDRLPKREAGATVEPE